MSNVPGNWELTTLGSLADDISYGYTASATAEPIGPKLLRITDIQEGQVDWTTVPYCSEGASPKFLLRDGDIVIARTGATTGKSFLIRTVPESAVFASYLIRIRTSGGVNPEYLSAFLQSPDYWSQIQVVSKGTAQPGANASILSGLEVPLAPIDEQRRIVAKIDNLSGKSKRARDHLNHVPRLVEKYKAVILAAAFQGALTVDWREKNTIASGWSSRQVGSVLRGIIAGKNLRCEERPPNPHEHGVLKVSAVSWGRFDPMASKTLPKSFDPPERTRVQPGDFLISRANTLELVGAVVIVEDTPPNLFLSDKILRLEMTDEDKPWLLWYLRSPEGRSAIEDRATGNQLSMRNLSQEALCSISVPWPEARERTQIVRRIETAFAWIDRLASEATSARKLIEHLDQAILSKAFRGELVSQDPNDEPASVLLERIRAGREAGGAKPQRRNRRGSNAGLLGGV